MSTWGSVFMKGLPGAVGSVVNYITASQDAKTQRKWQAYNNALVRLQNGMNQNAITTNEGMAVERASEAEYAIRKSEYITKASAEVSAAATGTTGRSVNAVLFDVGRNAAKASADKQRDLDYQMLGFQQQREQSNLQTEMQIDNSRIPGPNPADVVMGLTTPFVNAWAGAGQPALFTRKSSPYQGPNSNGSVYSGVKNKL